MDSFQHLIATELGISSQQVNAVQSLLDAGNTVAFIARYRKEATGGVTDEDIIRIQHRLGELAELAKRRESILSSLRELGHLTPELQKRVEAAPTMAILEDIYLPYRPKRRTRAEIARERGLEPLAKSIFFFKDNSPLQPEKFINPTNDVVTAEDALAGARDIIAEWVNENGLVRGRLRTLFEKRGLFTSAKGKASEETLEKYKDYWAFSESISKSASHRILALFRGEKEGALKLSVRPEQEEGINLLKGQFAHANREKDTQIKIALEDSYKRLLQPSLENELRSELKKRADGEATAIFAANLKRLLLTAPLGGKRVLALDPGFRTGAKLVCLDEQGNLLHNTTIFPTLSDKQRGEAAEILQRLVKKYRIEAIAIGNGTAGRETESFVRKTICDTSIIITMVNESGASVYSASAVGRAEFPDHDVTVRGAVSIGRRLQDPLAELVKIDPKAIGVGQYQHDINQTVLKDGLDEVVSLCVNQVGVELNTASASLLSFVSGIGPNLAENIVNYRKENGAFSSRAELKKVPRLGTKAYVQCAGFLRIRDAKNPLDNTAVHPERYDLVKAMAAQCKTSLADFVSNKDLHKSIVLENYISEDIGLPTLMDIMDELALPGRDPRPQYSHFSFSEHVHSIKDLHEGQILPGIVTNVTAFGAFVDIGVHQDGLVHISQLANHFVKDPNEVVQVQQEVQVKVLEVDIARKRIALSMR